MMLSDGPIWSVPYGPVFGAVKKRALKGIGRSKLSTGRRQKPRRQPMRQTIYICAHLPSPHRSFHRAHFVLLLHFRPPVQLSPPSTTVACLQHRRHPAPPLLSLTTNALLPAPNLQKNHILRASAVVPLILLPHLHCPPASLLPSCAIIAVLHHRRPPAPLSPSCSTTALLPSPQNHILNIPAHLPSVRHYFNRTSFALRTATVAVQLSCRSLSLPSLSCAIVAFLQHCRPLALPPLSSSRHITKTSAFWHIRHHLIVPFTSPPSLSCHRPIAPSYQNCRLTGVTL